MFDLIAHRGVSKEAPENTLIAFKKAIELEVDFIELDVHLTKDGVPVVIHDALLGRTTNGDKARKVIETYLKDLSNLDAGQWFAPQFQGEKIPTLDEVLALPRGNTGLMIEIKKGFSPPKQIAQAVSNSVQNAQNAQGIYVGSFSPIILEDLRLLMDNISLIGILEDASLLPNYSTMGLNHLAIWHKLLHPQMIEELHAERMKVWTFTVDDLPTVEFLLSIGVDGIITNDPRSLVNVRNRLKTKESSDQASRKNPRT